MIENLNVDKLTRHNQKITVSVIGGHDSDGKVEELAYVIGKNIAEVGAVLICGGLFGVMQAASKGAKEAGGLTLGILPGKSKLDANPYIDVAIPTSIGFARNALVACSADIIVALPGSYGTNSEICYGLVFGRPVIDLGNWEIKGMIKAKDAAQTKSILQEIMEEIRSSV